MASRCATWAFIVFLVAAVAYLSACGESELVVEPSPTIKLLAESNLTAGCYEWPTPPLGLPDAVDYDLPLSAGEPAIDFTLSDSEGTPHTLAGLLATKPVLIVFGAYT